MKKIPSHSSTSQNSHLVARTMSGSIVILVMLIIILVAGIGGYFGYTMVFVPTRVKQQVQSTQPVYEQSVDSVDTLSDQLADDEESLDVSAEDIKKIILDAKDDKKLLSTQLDNIHGRELQPWKSAMANYIQKTDQLIVLGEGAQQFIEVYTGVFRDVEQIGKQSQSLGGKSPDQIVQKISDMIREVDTLKESLQMASINDSLTSMNDATITFLDQLKIFLGEVNTAIQSKAIDRITSAEKQFAQASQQFEKDVNRASDQFEKDVVSVTDEIAQMEKEIEREYSALKSRYRF